ncbi:leukotriene A4 hydrolase C-terminal domain-containing protein [Phenylobacterium sp.]|uniref:leukotriene A4 hydrolase C-terminal domain-containing protein n=1 Tax=Phenylobacterium sp. TaxID=1871053 RepID=UPI002F94ED53
MIAALPAFLASVGRGLLVSPLYTGLTRQGDWGRRLARQYFGQARATYHPSLAGRLEQTLRSGGA